MALLRSWMRAHLLRHVATIAGAQASTPKPAQAGIELTGIHGAAMTPTSAHWEQASSADDGKTWQTNWIMELQRVE